MVVCRDFVCGVDGLVFVVSFFHWWRVKNVSSVGSFLIVDVQGALRFVWYWG